MQNGARYQAVIEILTEILQDKVPADKIVNDYIRAHRFIGSKDRRFIVEKVWYIVRNRMKLEFDAGEKNARKLVLYEAKDRLEQIFDGANYGVEPLSDEEKKWLEKENENPYPDFVEAECPEWLFAKIGSMDFCKALNKEASTDIRAHGIERDELIKKLQAEGIEASAAKFAPKGVKINERLVLNNCMAWQDGLFDVQDEASQLAALMADVRPEHKIVDYCCGAGGKSLAMSDCLEGQGRIWAFDVDAKRLDAMKPRLARLKVKNIVTADSVGCLGNDFDRFVLDVPCSGTGTWRRAPDAKFRLTKEKLCELKKTQAELLELAATKTKSGGRIVYITCSVLCEENEDNIERFIRKYPQFEPISMRKMWSEKVGGFYPAKDDRYLRFSPLTTGTDGFFVCVLENRI